MRPRRASAIIATILYCVSVSMTPRQLLRSLLSPFFGRILSRIVVYSLGHGWVASGMGVGVGGRGHVRVGAADHRQRGARLGSVVVGEVSQ
jgi:hypothetical protein